MPSGDVPGAGHEVTSSKVCALVIGFSCHMELVRHWLRVDYGLAAADAPLSPELVCNMAVLRTSSVVRLANRAAS